MLYVDINGQKQPFGAVITQQEEMIIMIGGETFNIPPSHGKAKDIRTLLNMGKYAEIVELLDLKSIVRKAIANTDGLEDDEMELVDNGLRYNGLLINNALTRRIIRMAEQGDNISAMLRFFKNLMENPSMTSVDELYLFLESCDLPITTDGNFLAYKVIRNNWKDKHSGTFDNSVGKTVKMARNQVDDDRHRTCSKGLHFCSRDYIHSFGYFSGEDHDRVVIVEINPADVVAIPSDYNNSKGRCWKYTVVAEYKDFYEHTDASRDFTDRAVIGDDYELDENGRVIPRSEYEPTAEDVIVYDDEDPFMPF